MIKRKKGLYLILLSFILLLGIVFSIFRTTLRIDGTVNIAKTTWDVHFENVGITVGSVDASLPPYSDDITTKEMSYIINFTKPGDFYEFTADIVNDGSIDAMVDIIENNVYSSDGVTKIDLPSYLSSTVLYDDGVSISKKQLLKHGTREKIKVRVEFKKDIDVSDLPSDGDTTIKFKIIEDYIQADDDAKDRFVVCSDNIDLTTLSSTKCLDNEVDVNSGIVCKRAIRLHQEECFYCQMEGDCDDTSSTYYCSGSGYTSSGSKATSTITYGNCGTQGNAPVSGDAFTCDVNGDGEFDELYERFYYVSDYYDTTNKVFDSSTAVLIYYNNVTGGVSCNKNTFQYNSNGNFGENWHGPNDNLKLQLPTVSQWSNISLKNQTRAILGEYLSIHDSLTTEGGTLPTNYSYSGYSARFLTAKELMSACNITEVGNNSSGQLDNCNYLLENTKYSKDALEAEGYWLETPNSKVNQYYSSTNVWTVYSRDRYLSDPWARMFYYARPVIEVQKSKMLY